MEEAAFRDHVLRIRIQGFTVLPGVLAGAECEEGVRELRRILDEERPLAEARGAAGEALGPGGGWAYALMNKARVFERTYQHPDVLRILRHFLGDDCVLSSVQGRELPPGAPAQGMHYDGGYTGPFQAPPAADGGRRITGHVLSMNVLYCLTRFTRENGGTRFVPGTHRHEEFGIPDDHPPGEVVVEAPRGSAIVFDAAVWHGGSANASGETRSMVSTPWRRSWLRPEQDLSSVVRADVLARAGPQGRVVFGFASRSPYVERWQWDARAGRPKPAWRDLERDEPEARPGVPVSVRAGEERAPGTVEASR